jgi:hypothetical protein
MEAGAVAAMGPSAHHVRARELTSRLAAVGEVIEVTLSVVASTYAPKGT